MNHAHTAIKEGTLTNSMHCVHGELVICSLTFVLNCICWLTDGCLLLTIATISGPQRCSQDRESIKMQKQLELGKEIFYNSSDWLSLENPKGLSEFQALLASVSFLIALRGRLYIAYPGTYPGNDASGFDCASSSDLRYSSADGSCNSIAQPFMGAVGTRLASSGREW